MATDLQSRPASKIETHLQRKFAAVAARMQRVDVIAHLLLVGIAILIYALFAAAFDWFFGASIAVYIETIRWTAFGIFIGAVGLLGVLAVRSLFRRVNPYYVAHQLEGTLPDAKNGLINWLDLHERELPSAFQKNLSARAADRWDESDADEIIVKRKLWILGTILGTVLVCLAILFVLDPSGFLASMRRAFMPFFAPAVTSRTHITLLEPRDGDVEVNPTQSVKFVARIEGRVPASDRADVPKLQYRYHADEDFFQLPLIRDDAGVWTAHLQPTQIRAGVTYKVSAGDAESLAHQIHVRARAHVSKVEMTYRHRPFRKLADSSDVFANANAARPYIRGPRGSTVEMFIHTSRPIKTARIELVGDEAQKELPVTMVKGQPHQFVCHFVLDKPAQFRIAYSAVDGEENIDRDLCNIDVSDDAPPSVVLTRPGKDIELPFNSSIILEGKATSAFGIRGFTLQFRDPKHANVSFTPLVYRAGKSFQLDDGRYPLDLEYMEFVALDQLKLAGGTLTPGGVLEYWLEAADGTDYPNTTGNVGKSAVYKLKLLPAPADPKQEQIKRKDAITKKTQHEKKQDQPQKKDEQKKSDNKNGGGPSPPDALNQIQKENADTQNKLENAAPEPQPDRGEAKGAEPKGAQSKGGPVGSDAPEPQSKDQPSMDEGNAGESKGQGGDGGGQARERGEKSKSGNDSQGNAKGVEEQGPGQQGAKTNGPPELQPKGGMGNDAGSAKSEPKEGPSGQARGDDGKMNPKEPSLKDLAKNIEQLLGNGPDAEAAVKALVAIAQNANDPGKREMAGDALVKAGRDPENGKKAPNPYGSGSKSSGISDELKAAAAKLEFAARIGQMQLDDWKKRLTPDLLKKAGVSEAEWERYIKNTRDFDAHVRALNAQIARQALKKLNTASTPGVRATTVEGAGTSNEARGVTPPPPPELRDPQREFSRPRNP